MIKGLGVSSGIAIGKIQILCSEKIKISERKAEDTDYEIENLVTSIAKSKEQIEDLYYKALDEIGEDEAQIFKAHSMILEDAVYINEIKGLIINDAFNAAYSVSNATQKYVDMFESMEDEYLRERAADLKDVSVRLIKNILGIKTDIYSLNEDVIVMAEDLTPSDTAALNKERVLGFITREGGATSHTAIIARTLEIPAIVGVSELEKLSDGDFVILDGDKGEIIVDPDENLQKEFEQKKQKLIEAKHMFRQYVGKDTITKDGRQVSLGANIGSLEDLKSALQNGVEGIGLFRTELFYLERDSLPTEDEQFETYKQLAEKMNGMPIIIRTLDVGGDKEIPYMELPKELNPFLGYRAIRLCLDRKKMFLAQLRAILRAGKYGNVKILIPMISSMEELVSTKKLFQEAKDSLEEEGIDFEENVELGIMMEVPSAAIISDLLAKEVDFFSIGTNDLIQYTAAVDRGNQKVGHLYNEFNPGVLRLINTIIQNAHKQGIWVGMCGEAACNNLLVPLFIAMGLDEFSMNSVKVPEIRCLINNIEYERTKELMDVLNYSTSQKIINVLSEFIKESNINNQL